MAVGYSKVFNARYLVTQCSRLFRGNSVLLPSFLLSFSLFFFADDTDHDTLATNLVHPFLPSPPLHVSYATEEAIVGSSAMFRYLIPEHFFRDGSFPEETQLLLLLLVPLFRAWLIYKVTFMQRNFIRRANLPTR